MIPEKYAAQYWEDVERELEEDFAEDPPWSKAEPLWIDTTELD